MSRPTTLEVLQMVNACLPIFICVHKIKTEVTKFTQCLFQSHNEVQIFGMPAFHNEIDELLSIELLDFQSTSSSDKPIYPS